MTRKIAGVVHTVVTSQEMPISVVDSRGGKPQMKFLLERSGGSSMAGGISPGTSILYGWLENVLSGIQEPMKTS